MPGAFNVNLIGPTCTASPSGERGEHRGEFLLRLAPGRWRRRHRRHLAEQLRLETGAYTRPLFGST